ncbi:MAG TPA: LysE family transporter [Dongiaceae bacterium]|nr:LysE family transporter [Dongiaceae bacterium]
MTDFSLSQGVSVLAAFAAVHLLVAASPGPAFLAVSRTAISASRSAGVIGAAAMATGALIWAVATLFGLHVLFAQSPWLYDALRLGGAAYLIYLGVGMLHAAWRGKGGEPMQLVPAGRATFVRCLAVQLSNPKAAVFFGSIFVTLLPAEAPLWVKGAALAILAINEFSWYALVAMVLSAPRARRIYGNAKRGLDALFGGFLTALGVKLALSR